MVYGQKCISIICTRHAMNWCENPHTQIFRLLRNNLHCFQLCKYALLIKIRYLTCMFYFCVRMISTSFCVFKLVIITSSISGYQAKTDQPAEKMKVENKATWIQFL